MTVEQLSRVMWRDKQLIALWGRPGEIKASEIVGGREGPVSEGLTPDDVMAQLGAMDRQILEQGFEKLGISQQTIQQLRDLEGLASNGGKFLSVSVESTHKMYFIQLVRLFEKAEQINKTYLQDKNLSAKDHAFWFRLYTDMVKEHGKGYQMMFQGAEALIAMLQASGRMPVAPGPSTPTPQIRNNTKAKKEKPAFAQNGD